MAQCRQLPSAPQRSQPMRQAGDSLVELCEYSFRKILGSARPRKVVESSRRDREVDQVVFLLSFFPDQKVDQKEDVFFCKALAPFVAVEGSRHFGGVPMLTHTCIYGGGGAQIETTHVVQIDGVNVSSCFGLWWI